MLPYIKGVILLFHSFLYQKISGISLSSSLFIFMSASHYNLELLRNPSTRTEAFGEMVRELSPQLYTQIRRIVQYHEDADDVLQNTFMKAWQAIDQFRGDCQLSTWLYRIALNESLAFLQKQKIMRALIIQKRKRYERSRPTLILMATKPNCFCKKP